ncbi:MAG: sortase [Defluviitaleaceae bacterium]|nr:sortase [Defluviitaleaceae bacterium]
MKKFALFLIIAVIAAAIAVSGFELFSISDEYTGEEQISSEMDRYDPAISAASEVPTAAASEAGTAAVTSVAAPSSAPAPIQRPTVNQSIAGLQSDVNPDVVGWLTIPGTRINYPFVLAADNSYYLRRDIHGNQAQAGTLFMDYRCAGDFSDFNTIIYGHNMNDKSMFGELSMFDDPDFFAGHRDGTVFLKDRTYKLAFFAYMTVDSQDSVVYAPEAGPQEFYGYAGTHASVYYEPDARYAVLTLSTCSYAYNGARGVLLAALYPM